MIASRLTVVAMVLLLSGCADAYSPEAKVALTDMAREAISPHAMLAASPEATQAGLMGAPAAPAGGPPQAPAVPNPRKIIYNADVAIVVEDFPIVTTAIPSLVAKFEGYIADTDVAGSTGGSRHATWKVRIPVVRFDEFLNAVSKLGELQRRQIHSQDVTEEFYDLEVRIKNKKVEEARLVKLLTESTGKLDEILTVEREISRVREEIERMEGRIRLLANLSDLTTVTIIADERMAYVPETNPSFTTRISRTFEASLNGLRNFLEGLTLLLVSVIPWIPMWILGALIAWFVLRRLRKRYPNFITLKSRPNPA